jgi:MarR family transcriptional regulator, lower aerobic nicotinate degradation pathway regulator
VDRDNAPDRLRTLPSWLLAQLSMEARRVAGDVLAKHEVHRSEYALLASLEQFGASNQTQLGERSGLDRSDIVRWVDDLAERGLVARERDPDDRRRNVVTVTASGRRLLGKLDTELRSAQDQLLSPLTAGERTQLTRLLQRALGIG